MRTRIAQLCLSDFLEKTQSVRLESLLFHLHRKDFQNWFEKSIGDSELAKRMEKIVPTNDNKLRTEIQATIRRRIDELKDIQARLMVDDGLIVTVAGSTAKTSVAR